MKLHFNLQFGQFSQADFKSSSYRCVKKVFAYLQISSDLAFFLNYFILDFKASAKFIHVLYIYIKKRAKESKLVIKR